MATNTTPGSGSTIAKKKRPPTFQHFPKNRAAKLKKEWVEKQKVRSQWKAQKRKEGLFTQKPAESTEELGEASDEPDREPSGNFEPVNKSEPLRSGNRPDNNRDGHLKNVLEVRNSEDTVGEAKSSVRESRRKAFSTETLHNYKSDPLHRRKETETRRGHSSTGRGRGRGRGQPNMKYRMEAVLERIKRDFS